MAKKKENFLDYIPTLSDDYTWDTDEKGRVTVHVVHRGFYAWIAQKMFHRPRVSHIALDAIGSFIYTSIDGTKTVGELALLLKGRFGEKAEPLYDRLIQYLQILRNNRFITYQKKGTSAT